jgi:hypothetical protein
LIEEGKEKKKACVMRGYHGIRVRRREQRVQRRKGTCDVLPFKVTIFVGRTNLIAIHSQRYKKPENSSFSDRRTSESPHHVHVRHEQLQGRAYPNGDLQPKIHEPLGWSNWMVLEQLDSRVEWVFFFNACTSMKAIWDGGILGRKNALNGHVQFWEEKMH